MEGRVEEGEEVVRNERDVKGEDYSQKISDLSHVRKETA